MYLHDWSDQTRKLPKEVKDRTRRRAKEAIEVTSYYINREKSADHLSPLSDKHNDIIMSVLLLGAVLGRWGMKYIWKSVIMLLGASRLYRKSIVVTGANQCFTASVVHNLPLPR